MKKINNLKRFNSNKNNLPQIYDFSREEMYPLPEEEIMSYCEGKPCNFHHPERALDEE